MHLKLAAAPISLKLQ